MDREQLRAEIAEIIRELLEWDRLAKRARREAGKLLQELERRRRAPGR